MYVERRRQSDFGVSILVTTTGKGTKEGAVAQLFWYSLRK